MSSEIIPNSIISFINLRKSRAFWSRRENWRNDVLNLLGRTAKLKPEVEIESCPDYPRAFPSWNDVPFLLLNHSNHSITESRPTVLSGPKIDWKQSQNFSSRKQKIETCRSHGPYLSTWFCLNGKISLFNPSPDRKYQNLGQAVIPSNFKRRYKRSPYDPGVLFY